MNNISLKRIIAGITSIIIPCICFSLNFTNSEIVNAKSTSVLDDFSDDILTVIACTDDGINRQVVVGKLKHH